MNLALIDLKKDSTRVVLYAYTEEEPLVYAQVKFDETITGDFKPLLLKLVNCKLKKILILSSDGSVSEKELKKAQENFKGNSSILLTSTIAFSHHKRNFDLPNLFFVTDLLKNS